MTPDDLYMLRRKARLTQRAMAKRLNVTTLTIHNWERGKHRMPRYLEQRLLSMGFGTPNQLANYAAEQAKLSDEISFQLKWYRGKRAQGLKHYQVMSRARLLPETVAMLAQEYSEFNTQTAKD